MHPLIQDALPANTHKTPAAQYYLTRNIRFQRTTPESARFMATWDELG